MSALNVLKLADVLSPPPRLGAKRKGAVVWVVSLANDAHTGSCGGQAGFPSNMVQVGSEA